MTAVDVNFYCSICDGGFQQPVSRPLQIAGFVEFLMKHQKDCGMDEVNLAVVIRPAGKEDIEG